jgi:hypothetical protein
MNAGPKNVGSGSARSIYVPSKNSGPLVTLEAANPTEPLVTSGESISGAASPGPVTLAAGTRAQIILLGGVSASRSRAGDSFLARLVAPVRLNSKVVLPEGTLLGGKVVKSTPPRVLSRAGSLLLTFTDLTCRGGRASRRALRSQRWIWIKGRTPRLILKESCTGTGRARLGWRLTSE